MSTLGASPVHLASLHYPDTGSPRADLVLTGGAPPAVGSKQTLTLAGFAVTMTVLRSDLDAPNRPHVVLVGGVGWEQTVATPPSYENDAGVRLRTVLADLASRAGETIEPPTDITIGDYWSAPASRPGEPLRLRDVLAALYEQGFCPVWRVDPDGVTRFGLRTGAAVTARATIMRRDIGVGLRVIGIDAPAAFMPGGTIDGGAVIRRVVFNETPSSLTAEVWSDARLSFRSRILRMVAEAFPALVYGYPRTYRVAAVGNDGRLDLAPPADMAHLQPLTKVEPWTPYGITVTPAVGSLLVVGFRDALPSRPFVLGYAPVTPGPAAARVGDNVGRLLWDASLFTLYYSPSPTAAYAPVASVPVPMTPPLPAAVGTNVNIATGSSVVKVIS